MKPRKPIKQKSSKQLIIDKTLDVIREILKIERGNRDEFTGLPGRKLGLFHIMLQSSHPRLKFCRQNMILTEWMPYHYWYHHDNKKTKRIVIPLIIKLRGVNYEQDLLIQEAMQPKQSIHWLRVYLMAVRQELKELRRNR